MTKRFKLISFAIAMVLCVSIIGIGIYAASSISPTFSANVTFTPTNAKFQVLGFIDGLSPENYSDANVHAGYYACNYNTTPVLGNYTQQSQSTVAFNTWSFGDLTLNAGNNNGAITRGDLDEGGISMPEDMVIYIQLTNFIERDISYTFVYSGNLSQNNLSISGEYYLTDNLNLTGQSANGFYQINPNIAWGALNTPSAAPSGTVSGTVFTPSTTTAVVVNSGTSNKTIMLKLTISPTQNFDPTVDMNRINFSFTVGANIA